MFFIILFMKYIVYFLLILVLSLSAFADPNWIQGPIIFEYEEGESDSKIISDYISGGCELGCTYSIINAPNDVNIQMMDEEITISSGEPGEKSMTIRAEFEGYSDKICQINILSKEDDIEDNDIEIKNIKKYSGGNPIKVKQKKDIKKCSTDWICPSWSSCLNDKQTRECHNGCGDKLLDIKKCQLSGFYKEFKKNKSIKIEYTPTKKFKPQVIDEKYIIEFKPSWWDKLINWFS